jgi:hypothetical protein
MGKVSVAVDIGIADHGVEMAPAASGAMGPGFGLTSPHSVTRRNERIMSTIRFRAIGDPAKTRGADETLMRH